jgi:hypothetical protein
MIASFVLFDPELTVWALLKLSPLYKHHELAVFLV